jgi:hypothetical protein
MESKVCSKCRKLLPINEFINGKGIETGKCQNCREIQRKANAEYRCRNRETIRAKARVYHQEHKDEINHRVKLRRTLNREAINSRAREYYATHKEQHRAIMRRWSDKTGYYGEYRTKHRDKIGLYLKAYYETHRDDLLLKGHTYYECNRERILEKGRERGAKYRGELSDTYIRQRLIEIGFDKNNITPELIELKRAEMLLNRTIKNYDNEKN